MADYVDYWFKSNDGLNLYARDYQHQSPTGTLICIPGLTRNCADFTALCQHLAPSYRIIAVDLRGRGRSDYDPNPLNYHPGTYVEDIAALIDALQLDDVVLVGTSLGGLVSMFLTAMQPSRIAAMIINDIGPEANPAGLERIKSYVCNPPPVISWKQAISTTRDIMAHAYPNFNDSDWEAFCKNLFKENDQGIPERNYDPAISVLLEQQQDNAVPPDLWPLFRTLESKPLLLFRGQLSDVLTMACVETMKDLHPDMQFVEIAQCGHTPLLSENTSLQAIDRFLHSLAKQ